MQSLCTRLLLVFSLVISVWAQSGPSTSNGLSFVATPIDQLATSPGSSPSGAGTYKGFQGGLYENGSNVVPSDHDAAGKKYAAQVAPINGKIVLLSIGMSNAKDEFGTFLRTYGTNPAINPSVAIVNGAQNGIGACSWTVAQGMPGQNGCYGNAPNPYDLVLNTELTPAGLTESQVEVVWLKEANSLAAPFPPSLPVNTKCPPAHVLGNTTCADAYVYEGYLGGILRAAKTRYPNLKLVFISSRIYGGYNQSSKSHEPYTYEYGFSTKWAIQAQINQADRGSQPDPIAGNLSYGVAPWAVWGPYLWADGNIARSDGLAWCNGQSGAPCNGEVDIQPDGVHPNATGQAKVASMLWSFFTTSPYTTWFTANGGAVPGNVSITISPTGGNVTSGGTMQFTASLRGTSNTAVTWSTTAGSVSNTGLLTAPSVTADSNATVVATSVADPTQQAVANVTVSPSTPAPPPPPQPQPAPAPPVTNTIAGGIMALPPAQALGTNHVTNPGFESGSTGWSLPACFSIATTGAHTGSKSLLFTAGSGCSTHATATTTVTRSAGDARSYTLQGWVKTSASSNFQVKISLHDQTDGSDIVAETAYITPGNTWTFIQQTNVDLLPIHDGHTLSVQAVVQGSSGTASFDDVQLIDQQPLPISTYLLYPNYKGYLWGDGPQTIRLQVEVPNPAGANVVATVQTAAGSNITSVEQSAQSTQELDIDGTKLATGSYLISTSLLDGSGNTIATYPGYRINKVDPGFRSKLVNYIDTDNFLVRNGQKHFVWGVYDRWASNRCTQCVFTNENGYLQIPGFNGLTTVQNYADTMSNAEMNITPFAGVNISSTNNQLTPWLAAVDSVGVGHLQIVNNWVTGNRGRPIWAKSIPDQQLWQMLTTVQSGNPGGLGYYNYDEPTTDKIPGVFNQWPTLSAGDPGGVLFGTLARVNQVFRWRDMADVMSCDPYPVGNVPDLNDYAYGARTSPPMIKTSIWTREVVSQSYGSRPVWMVAQLFDLNNQFPTYSQMKMQAYKAIINGATGILWWGFVSEKGIEYEWYVVGNHQPYLDFKQISGEVMALEPYLIAPSQPQLMSAVSNPAIEYMVKADSKKIYIFASNFSDQAVDSVTFALSPSPTVQAVPVQVYSEGRTVPLVGNSFTDTFAPNDVHVYELSLQ